MIVDGCGYVGFQFEKKRVSSPYIYMFFFSFLLSNGTHHIQCIYPLWDWIRTLPTSSSSCPSRIMRRKSDFRQEPRVWRELPGSRFPVYRVKHFEFDFRSKAEKGSHQHVRFPAWCLAWHIDRFNGKKCDKIKRERKIRTTWKPNGARG